MPIHVISKEDDDIDVSEANGSINVVWPIYVSFVPLMRGGCAKTASVTPQRAKGGNFSWPDNFCFGQWIKQFANGNVTNSHGIINVGGL